MTRLDRQISPPPTSSHYQQDKTTDNSGMSSQPHPAPSPSWLRSESKATHDSSTFTSDMTELDNNRSHRPAKTSDRSSGIRRQLPSQRVDSFPDLSRPASRPMSGRMSGIRGELYSRQKSRPPSGLPLASVSDPHLPTFLDRGVESDQPARLQTAVLAQGRKTIPLNSSGSQTCLVPSIGDDIITATPNPSQAKPKVSSTHSDSGHYPRPHHLERQSVNECLESISKFDHLHLGQITSNIQGTCTVLHEPRIQLPIHKLRVIYLHNHRNIIIIM